MIGHFFFVNQSKHLTIWVISCYRTSVPSHEDGTRLISSPTLFSISVANRSLHSHKKHIGPHQTLFARDKEYENSTSKVLPKSATLRSSEISSCSPPPELPPSLFASLRSWLSSILSIVFWSSSLVVVFLGTIKTGAGAGGGRGLHTIFTRSCL